MWNIMFSTLDIFVRFFDYFIENIADAIRVLPNFGNDIGITYLITMNDLVVIFVKKEYSILKNTMIQFFFYHYFRF